MRIRQDYLERKDIMNFDWYKILNLNEFAAVNVPDLIISAELENIGLKSFRVLKGIIVSVIVDGILLTPDLFDNPSFNLGNRSAYIDSDNNLWVGFQNESDN